MRNIFVTMILFGSFSYSLAQDICWVQKTDMPTARNAHAVGTVNGKIYAVGGEQLNSTVLEEYDPTTDTWMTKSPMPTERGWLSCNGINDKIYAIGGYNTSFPQSTVPDVEEYNPISDTWSTKSPIPTPRWGHGTGIVNGKIYVIGGAINWPATFCSTVEQYDPSTDTWTTKSSIPTQRWGVSCCVVNGKIYAIGGESVNGTESIVEEYDPVTDTWTTKSPMPTARWGLTVGMVNGKIYAIGGGDLYPPMEKFSTVEEYDPATDSWTTNTPMPVGRIAHAPLSVSINGKLYVIGGGGIAANVTHAEVYEYDPHKDLAGIIDYLSIDRSYAEPGIDSVLITTKMKCRSEISLLAEIETPDHFQVDSLQLFDDGNHNDGDAGDSLFANTWPTPSVDEKDYYIDLVVTRVDTDTVVNHFNNTAVFTTTGPVVFDNYTITSSDTIPHHGDKLKFEFILKNMGLIDSVKNVTSRIYSLDNHSIPVGTTLPGYGNIAPGQPAIGSKKQYIQFNPFSPDSVYAKFRLDIYSNKNLFWTDTFSVFIHKDPTGLEVNKNSLPKEFDLKQNYPNPFNPKTNIQFSIPKTEFVTLKIYNLLGQEIETLVEDKLNPGHFKYVWNASGIPSGVYFYQLKTKSFCQTKKLMLLR